MQPAWVPPTDSAVEAARRHDADALPRGARACLLFANEEEKWTSVAAVAAAALARGERTLFLGQKTTEREWRARLAKHGLDPARAGENAPRYGAHPLAVPDTLALLTAAEAAARRAGRLPLRVVREVDADEAPLRGEAELEDALRGHAVSVVGLFDRRTFSPRALLDVVAAHPFVVVDQRAIPNRGHVPPRVALRKTVTVEDLDRALHGLEAADEAEATLAAAQRLAHLGTWEHDLRDGRVRASAEMFRIFGLQPQAEAPFEVFLSAIHPDDRAATERMYAKALEQATAWVIEHRIRRPDGAERIVREHGTTFRDAAGRPTRSVGTAQDVTDERRTTEAMARLAAVVASTASAVYTKSLDGAITSWNRGAERLYGYGEEEAIGRPASMLAAEGAEGDLARILATVAAGEAAERVEAPRRRKDGSRIFVSLTASPLRNGEGRIVGASVVAHDVTPLVEATAALRESEEKYRLLAENSADMVTVTDTAGRFVFASPSCHALLGYTPEELVGRSAATLIHPDDLESYRARRAAVVGGGTKIVTQLRLVRKDGTPVWIEASAAPLRRNGQIAGAVAVTRDVTLRKQAEDQVARLTAELEARVRQRTRDLEDANGALEAFAYSVSHDLRAPLRSIDGFSRAVLEDHAAALPAEGREALDRVRANAQRMGALIDDMLTLSRIGRGDLHRAPVDASALARRIADDLARHAPARRVTWVIPPGITVAADPLLAEVVLQNLLENAWKFTSRHATARIEVGESVEQGTRALYVRDDGDGFDMAYAGRLFTPFQRLHRLDEFPGNGVGLASVQRIAQRHGGRAWAEGAVEQGATFYVAFGE